VVSLVDKVAVVTGAAQGASVVLLDLPDSEGSRVAEEITPKGDEDFSLPQRV
jgi:hypothetical protein